MARPLKEGLEYFPMDVSIDEKIELLELKYGIEGFGVYIRTLQTIYKIKSGELLIGKDEFSAWKLIGKRSGKSEEYIKKFIEDAVEIGLFDDKMFNLGIITSNGIKKRLNEINHLRSKDRERKSKLVFHEENAK